MSNTNPRRAGHHRLAGLAGLLALTVVLTLASAPADVPAPASQLPAPTYAALQPLYRAGEAKQFDEGVFELYCNDQTAPSAWIWAADDTRDGYGREYWVMHTSYLYPGPANDGVMITFDHTTAVTPQDLSGFVSWIVGSYDHVTDASQLVIHECKVRPAD